jgi:hypothetical protein
MTAASIFVRPAVCDQSLHDFARQMLAWRLSHEGYRCFIPKNMAAARTERDGMVYTPH